MCGETRQSDRCCCEGLCIVVKPSDKGVCIHVRCDDEAKKKTSEGKAEGSGDSTGEDCCK
jgi:hypothetical protein